MQILLPCLLAATGISVPAAVCQVAVPGPPVEQRLAGGNLRVFSLYRVEAAVLSARGRLGDSATVEALVHQLYRPHATFWRGYVGDEPAFRKFAAGLVRLSEPVLGRLAQIERLPLDTLFRSAARWVTRQTGLEPRGTWYLVFGHGATDMGGVGDLMLIDFNAQPADEDAIRRILPHELTHMVYGRGPARRRDPHRGTVLDRIISEGVASYASYLSAGGESAASALLMADEDFRGGMATEAAMLAAIRPILLSSDRATVDSVAHRQKRLVPGGPTAAGYFLGFRLAQAYEAAHGRGSWKEILTLPLLTVVARSGYPLLEPGKR